MPWTSGFDLTRQPQDEREAARFKLRADPRFKNWLADLDCKLQQFEGIRRQDL